MTWYADISPMGEPMDSGPDDNGLATVSFSVICYKRGSTDVQAEIAKVLVDAGVGVLGTSIFGQSDTPMPDGNGPFIELIDTGGPPPVRTQQSKTAYQRPTVQVFTRARAAAAAMAKAKEAYAALAAVKNTEITA